MQCDMQRDVAPDRFALLLLESWQKYFLPLSKLLNNTKFPTSSYWVIYRWKTSRWRAVYYTTTFVIFYFSPWDKFSWRFVSTLSTTLKSYSCIVIKQVIAVCAAAAANAIWQVVKWKKAVNFIAMTKICILLLIQGKFHYEYPLFSLMRMFKHRIMTNSIQWAFFHFTLCCLNVSFLKMLWIVWGRVHRSQDE